MTLGRRFTAGASRSIAWNATAEARARDRSEVTVPRAAWAASAVDSLSSRGYEVIAVSGKPESFDS
jgi:hypothetical protein